MEEPSSSEVENSSSVAGVTDSDKASRTWDFSILVLFLLIFGAFAGWILKTYPFDATVVFTLGLILAGMLFLATILDRVAGRLLKNNESANPE